MALSVTKQKLFTIHIILHVCIHLLMPVHTCVCERVYACVCVFEQWNAKGIGRNASWHFDKTLY